MKLDLQITDYAEVKMSINKNENVIEDESMNERIRTNQKIAERSRKSKLVIKLIISNHSLSLFTTTGF